KPDVVAPGTDILSCRSSSAPAGRFWGLDPAHPTYGYMGGTSMAAPLVAGCAALVRQYFEQQRQHAPSAALLRATLVNGTRWLTGQHSNATNPPGGVVPEGNFDQGFGRIDMPATLPHPGNPDLVLAFEDNWQAPGDQLASTGDRRRWVAEVASASLPLRICLAYTDLPARALQYNLNLFVQAPDGTKYLGNQQLRLGLKIPDTDNNVEVLRIAAPAPGRYLIQITAQNLLKTPQDFALVVTGHLTTDQLTPA
nr:S8 family serine peptidase [Paracoccus sp. (in: a-proteobacteria)]